MLSHFKFALAVFFLITLATKAFADESLALEARSARHEHPLSVTLGKNSWWVNPPYASNYYYIWSATTVGFEYALSDRIGVEGSTSMTWSYMTANDSLRFLIHVDQAKWIGMKVRAWDFDVSPYPVHPYMTAGGMQVDSVEHFSSAYAGLGADVDFTDRFFGSIDAKATVNPALYAQLLFSIAYRL